MLGRSQQPEEKRPPPELPDIKEIIAAHSGELFLGSATAKNIRISTAVRQLDFAGRTEPSACVQADVANVAGKDKVTYVVSVADGKISNRRRAVRDDGCDLDSYEPLASNQATTYSKTGH